MKYLPGNIFENTLISSSADIPLSILAGCLYHKAGVRVAFPVAYTVSLIGSILLIFIQDSIPAFSPFMVLLARGGVK